MRKIGVGLLGCGVVGSAVVRGMQRLAATAPLELQAVAVVDTAKPRQCEVSPALLTTDARSVVDHPDVDVVVEVIGGLAPAAELLERALTLGKPVVTANKAVLGTSGPRLRSYAAQLGVPLLYEASVAGAVPLIRGLSGLIEADDLVKIEGVLNGTTTFVLSHMEQTGATMPEAVAEAQRLGFAELDPSRDLDGTDAADKLAVLVQSLFGEALVTPNVQRWGIDRLRPSDIVGGGTRRWRLIATAVKGRCARVEPVALRSDHPFAALTGPQSAVTITGERAGAITLMGTGAGGDATACSVLADVLEAVEWLGAGRLQATRPCGDLRAAVPR